MKFLADKSFLKDLSSLSSKEKKKVEVLLNNLKKANDLSEVPKIKKIRGYKTLYRIRLGDFRIGIRYQNQTLILIRILRRKDIYKYFPLFI